MKFLERFGKTFERFMKFSERFVKTFERFMKITERFAKTFERFMKFSERFVKTFERFMKITERFMKFPIEVIFSRELSVVHGVSVWKIDKAVRRLLSHLLFTLVVRTV